MLISGGSYYGTVIEQANKTRWNCQHSMMMVVPVHFSMEHKGLLNHTKILQELDVYL